MSFIVPLRVHQTARLRQIQAVTWAGRGLYINQQQKTAVCAENFGKSALGQIRFKANAPRLNNREIAFPVIGSNNV